MCSCSPLQILKISLAMGKILSTSNPLSFLSSREDFSKLINTSCDFKNVIFYNIITSHNNHIITSHKSSSPRWNLLFLSEESILPNGGSGLHFFPWAESVFLLAELHSHWSMLEQSLRQTFYHSFAFEQLTCMVCFLSKCTQVTLFREIVPKLWSPMITIPIVCFILQNVRV